MLTTLFRFTGLVGFLLLAACDSSTDDVGANPSAGAAGQAQAGTGGQAQAGQAQAGQAQAGQAQAGQAQGGAGTAGQAQGGAGGQKAFEEVRSDKPRADGSEVSEADRAAVVKGNTDFAFDLYGKLGAESENAGKNLFFSPISMTLALGMTEAGAKGVTQTEIDKALHFSLPPASLHPALNWLAVELGKRPQQARDYAVQGQAKTVPDATLNVVNAIWGEKTNTWQPTFLDVLSQSYGAGVNLGDFKGNAEGERQVINQWVSDQTEKRIVDLLPSGSLDDSTRIVLVNAINLTFEWANGFDPKDTKAAPFTVEGGAATSVATMARKLTSPYAEDALAQSVAIPLFSNRMSVVLYLPKAGQFAAFESQLATEVASLRAAEQLALVDLTLPKFKYTTPTFTIGKMLKSMGMKTPFEPQADFSPMTTTEPLLISDVYHKAMLGLDEVGVQAAAATAVVGEAGGLPPEPKTLHADRSFLVAIRDEGTGALLFFGRILDPTQP